MAGRSLISAARGGSSGGGWGGGRRGGLVRSAAGGRLPVTRPARAGGGARRRGGRSAPGRVPSPLFSMPPGTVRRGALAERGTGHAGGNLVGPRPAGADRRRPRTR